jgi:hypothetical protein
LVIGNPPYGDHRGLYKGLGEEPKISKYEDYFVKRSLDSLKPNGILAMVLPSGWLNRQKNLKNAKYCRRFSFAKRCFCRNSGRNGYYYSQKNSQKISTDISNYFEKHPSRILGETKKKPIVLDVGKLCSRKFKRLYSGFNNLKTKRKPKESEIFLKICFWRF